MLLKNGAHFLRNASGDRRLALRRLVPRVFIRIAFLMASISLSPSPVRADICMVDMWDNNTVNGSMLFPNWGQFKAASFDVLYCYGCIWQANEQISAVTVVNFGTALPADIKAVYVKAECGATNTGLLTLTYAGMYSEDSGTFPAWTWKGLSVNMAACAPLWVGGSGAFTISVYVDIDDCPASLRTVKMGFPINSANDPTYMGSLWDNAGCVVPWADTVGPQHMIAYVSKQGSAEIVAPGDTVNFTIQYGKPGTVPLTSIEIFDTLPPSTHYLSGSGVPAPDAGWDPNPGPPSKLKWTINPVVGNLPAWGPTNQVVFAVTVDWGNGDAFEPGSGDAAAAEGSRLDNVAQVFFRGNNCGPASWMNPPVTTVVRRFLFWKVADNDVLFSNSYGQSPDEITYSIFLKNVSATKTWWDVHVWDTVPADLDPWTPGFGLDDPCVGWTMSPSGCAPAGAGWMLSGGATLMTWKLDMPPGVTLTLRWKARVKATALPGGTVVNKAAVMEYGRTGLVDGTGHSIKPRYFTHAAPVILPTTYTSYIGVAAAESDYWACCNTGVLATQSYWLAFFPLNMKANFNLYEQIHTADAWTNAGGATPSINALAGDCMGGGADWIAGCKAERAPAFYKPAALSTCVAPTVPFHNIYKLVSNSPLLWEFSTNPAGNNMDNMTYVGATSLTYSGYTSYTYNRVCSYPQFTDGLYLVNTSSTLPTTAFVFRWDPAALDWGFVDTAEIGVNSQWFFNPDTAESYKMISSDAPLIVLKGYPGMTAGGAFNDSGTQSPNADNGQLVSGTVPADFYAYCGGPNDDGASLIVGNVGLVNADCEIWEYTSDNPLLPNPTATHLTTQILGSSGKWAMLGSVTVPAGLGAANNPQIFGEFFDARITSTFTLYKVRLLSGGPIQVYNGRDIFSPFGGGSVIHSVTPPAGTEYWFQMCAGGEKAGLDCAAPHNQIMTLDAYCPKAGTVVTAVSSAGYTATYTTPASDSCVSFKSINRPANGMRVNYKITSAGGIIAVMHQIHCKIVEKIYTAPFLSQGVHYTLIAPPVVYLGQSFWITVVVVESGGATKTDYTGTTSFTSTDPGAKIQGAAMDGYNYIWNLGNAGVKVFVNVTMTSLGLMTIVGQDTLDGSINGLVTVMVVAADIKLEKRKRLSVAASGDTVQFWICWSNYSSATGYSFTITDAVPNGTTYVPEMAGTMMCGTSGPAPSFSVAASASTTTTPPTNFATVNAGSTPGGTTRWLRWTVRDVYVNSTGCACFKVVVN